VQGNLKVLPPTRKNSVKDIKEFYKNYLQSMMLAKRHSRKCVRLLKKGWTYYGEASKKDQREKGKKKETFSIGWLKRLQAISNIFFCQKATMSNAEEVQELYFDGHLKRGTDLTAKTLISMAYKAKNRVSFTRRKPPPY
jgi:hypothetical protein